MKPIIVGLLVVLALAGCASSASNTTVTKTVAASGVIVADAATATALKTGPPKTYFQHGKSAIAVEKRSHAEYAKCSSNHNHSVLVLGGLVTLLASTRGAHTRATDGPYSR